MDKPEVSVIIPTHNYADYIGEALESVFNQSFNNFEVIVVDDGSSDSTRKIIESYGDQIRYFYQEQQGPAKARNKGIIESRGIYIAFLDADDIWYPTKLEKQMSLFKANPEIGMAITDNKLFDERGIYKAYVGKKTYLFKGDLAANIFINSGVVTPTVMVRREVFDKVGLFEEGLRIGEDDNMWIRIAVEYEVAIVDEALAGIRNHAARTMNINDSLVESVGKNIKLLTTKYGPKVASKILPLAPLKYHQLYFNDGYKYFENRDYPQARRQFLKALNYSCWHWKTYVYTALTFTPLWITSMVRLLKRQILPESFKAQRWS